MLHASHDQKHRHAGRGVKPSVLLLDYWSWASRSRYSSTLISPRTNRAPRIRFAESLSLPEREHVSFGAGFEERDLQCPLVNRVVLAYELVEATVPEHPVAFLVDVAAM